MSDTNTNSNGADGVNEENKESQGSETQEGVETQQAEAASEPSPEERLNEWKNKAVYFAAEIENMKKRFMREKADVIKMANEELIKGMIPVFDNLDLALKSIRDMESKAEENFKDNKVVVNLLKGVEMTLAHFQQTLERAGVEKVDSVGKPFDPALHEAMGQSTDENFADNCVSSEFQKGFTLHGRVIRSAKVIVNKLTKA
jgi:molecular chaperone GrpE